MRNEGRLCGSVEKWNPHVGPHGIRQDLFGFIDLISLDPARGIIGVQCCAGSGFSAHIRKILEERIQEAKEWLICGGRVEVWGWRKIKKKRGGKAMIWDPRYKEITMEDLI